MINLFNIALKLNGFPISKANKQLREILAVPEKEFAQFVATSKKEIVDYHLKHNPFYKKFVGDTSLNNWEDIPILKKIDLQIPLKERLSEGFSKRTVYINSTSGSSGDPIVFAKDKLFHALIWANISRRFSWYAIDFNHSYQARFYGMPLDFVGNLKLRFKDFLSHRYRFTIFDLSDIGLSKIITIFRKKKFDYINGYTTNLILLAKYLRKRKIILRNICPSLKVCMVTSEMLFEEDKILLETQLGLPIVNEYGASELDIIAFENPEKEWIVNAETLYVEILDENDNILPYGKEGRIVVTSLYNKAHPFIRYEVGDYGILDEKSTPKKPILKKLIGRTSDVALLPSGKKAPGMTFYSITKRLFNDEGNVKEFVIKQTKIDTFKIEYTSYMPLKKLEKEKMIKVFSTYLEPDLNYIFKRKELLKRSESGKLKQFVSMINENN